jgi:hypothetical protein
MRMCLHKFFSLSDIGLISGTIGASASAHDGRRRI